MSNWEAVLLSSTLIRLLLAATLGAIVGAERQIHHKAAGLRTIMFITFGTTLFMIISETMAGVRGGDPQRIAAQIIPGIGFIGAGSIIHARGSVVGLTTAATIFVMASIGMACGAGLYLIAIFSTLLLLVSLLFLGWLEVRLRWKSHLVTYTMTTRQLEQALEDLNTVLDKENLAMQHIRCTRAGEATTVEFSLDVPEELEPRLVQRFGALESVGEVGHSERMERE